MKEDFFWDEFKKTGDINAYLLYKKNTRDNEWKAVKQEESLCAEQTTENQTVC